MPCAVDYFEGFKKYLHFGMPVGLEGSGLKRLRKAKGDFPVYVWPGHPYLERNLLDAGLSMLTDYACLLYTSPSPRDLSTSRMPSSA